jgi:uncharacterized membrane protein SpoIIM required for sporulation
MAEPLPAFVRRRRASWEELGALLSKLEKGGASLADLGRLDGLYRRAASDLARARTFYPGSDAALYLNELCARGYGVLYRRRAGSGSALARFFRVDFPGTFIAEARFFWVALGLLAAGALVGAVAALVDPASVNGVVPDAVREHLEAGSLWTDSPIAAASPVMGSTIAANNMGVALSAFGLGLTAGLGTAAMLLFNGLHLGAILALCFQAKLGYRLLGFMVAHGFVEVAAILIAGQAGLIIGWAILAPGELSRADALRARGRAALRLVLGTLPLFLAIAMVEGFVSPGPLFPGWLKLALGLSLGGLLFAYLIRFGRQGGSGPRAEEG